MFLSIALRGLKLRIGELATLQNFIVILLLTTKTDGSRHPPPPPPPPSAKALHMKKPSLIRVNKKSESHMGSAKFEITFEKSLLKL